MSKNLKSMAKLSTLCQVIIFISFSSLIGCGAGQEGASIEQPIEIVDALPKLSITSPSPNTQFENEELVLLAGSATDNEDGDLSVNITWSSDIDGTLGSGALNVNLSPGTHVLTAEVEDTASHKVSSTVGIVVLAKDSTPEPPTLTISSPTNASEFSEGSNISFSATASDSNDNVISDQITWHSNVDGDLGNGASITTNLTLGDHIITASVTDSNNISSEQQISVSIIGLQNDTLPTISISSPLTNTILDEGSNVALTATASDNEDGDLTSLISWSSDISGNLGTGGSISSALIAGTHQITASVTDTGQNTNQFQIIVIVDQAPTVTIGNDFSAVEGQSVVLTATANDPDGQIQTFQWLQTSGINVELNNSDAESASFFAPMLQSGETSIELGFSITVTDSHGKTATDTVNVSIVETPDVSECTLTINPGDSFTQSFNQLSAGETLCLNSGRYQQAMDVPSDIHVRAVVTGGAEIDGGSTLGEEWSGGLFQMRGTNSSVDGLRVHHAGQYSDACNVGGTNNTMTNMSCSHGGSHKHKIPLKLSGSGHLIENSWFYGEGRYVVQCYRGSNMVIRGNVIRWDLTVAGEPDEPNASSSNYSCNDMIWENNISLDYGLPETYMKHCGDFCMSTTETEPNERVQYLGNIVVNHHPDTGNNKAFRADQKGNSPSTDITITDFYIRSVGSAFVFNPKYQNVTVTNCTTEDVQQDGYLDGQAISCNDKADIEDKYVNGVKTADKLFPWPNEELIKRDLCDSNERQSDWCATTLSLKDYLLNN